MDHLTQLQRDGNILSCKRKERKSSAHTDGQRGNATD